jgi:type I restriction enzyme S subunit
MARALFKSWFVDFDPVRAKMEGRDTGLPDHIADLFPDRLVTSEMGEIPEGWTVGFLGHVAGLRRGGIDPGDVASDLPYIGLEHMPRRSIALGDWGDAGSVSSRKSTFNAGDILFGKLRPYFHKVGIAPVAGLCSTDIVVLRARIPRWHPFVLACVSSSRFVAYTSQTSTGTKMPRTSWKTMSTYELCRPTDALAAEFRSLVSPMLERLVANVHESRTLAALRDTLLPKLISGEIRVPDVERVVAPVT